MHFYRTFDRFHANTNGRLPFEEAERHTLVAFA